MAGKFSGLALPLIIPGKDTASGTGATLGFPALAGSPGALVLGNAGAVATSVVAIDATLTVYSTFLGTWYGYRICAEDGSTRSAARRREAGAG